MCNANYKLRCAHNISIKKIPSSKVQTLKIARSQVILRVPRFFYSLVFIYSVVLADLLISKKFTR